MWLLRISKWHLLRCLSLGVFAVYSYQIMQMPPGFACTCAFLWSGSSVAGWYTLRGELNKAAVAWCLVPSEWHHVLRAGTAKKGSHSAMLFRSCTDHHVCPGNWALGLRSARPTDDAHWVTRQSWNTIFLYMVSSPLYWLNKWLYDVGSVNRHHTVHSKVPETGDLFQVGPRAVADLMPGHHQWWCILCDRDMPCIEWPWQSQCLTPRYIG